jgi:hypothetical protein
MIYPIVTQLKKKGRKDYNYWGIFSALLILLFWNLGLMAGAIRFEVEVAEFSYSLSRRYLDYIDYIDKMNGFGLPVLAMVILHL